MRPTSASVQPKVADVTNSLIETPDPDAAQREGFETGREGKSFRLCPYPPRSRMRHAWLDGYQLAMRATIPKPHREDFRTCLGDRS